MKRSSCVLRRLQQFMCFGPAFLVAGAVPVSQSIGKKKHSYLGSWRQRAVGTVIFCVSLWRAADFMFASAAPGRVHACRTVLVVARVGFGCVRDTLSRHLLHQCRATLCGICPRRIARVATPSRFCVRPSVQQNPCVSNRCLCSAVPASIIRVMDPQIWVLKH